MNPRIYDPARLMPERVKTRGKKVLQLGCGAVGSQTAVSAVRAGASVTCVDMDHYTPDNFSKTNPVIRMPEDIGRSKAEALAERLQPLLDRGQTANGIHTDVRALGPEALSPYDILFVALDNMAAKDYVNSLWMRLPADRRPVLVQSGTSLELAESVILDGSGPCLRCLMDESWLQDGEVRTSCTGPQIRLVEGVPKIIPASDSAGILAAQLAMEQFRGWATDAPEVLNHRLTYTAYPAIGLASTRPLRKKHCPGCAIQPPDRLQFLSGSVLDLTLGQALEQIGEQLHSQDFQLLVHNLVFGQRSHASFIVDSTCRCCGKPIHPLRHDGRTRLNDLVCEDCAARGLAPSFNALSEEGTLRRIFTPRCSQELLRLSLFDLGYPLGAHLQVLEQLGDFDILDGDGFRVTAFTCSGDPSRMFTTSTLYV